MTAHDGMGECPACGIVVAKYRQQPRGDVEHPVTHKASGKKGTYIAILAVVLGIAVSCFIYWFIPPLFFFDPGDPSYGAIAESAGGPFSNYTARSWGRYVRIRSHSARWKWTAKAARQPQAFALSTDGQYLATAALPRAVKIWERGLFRYNPVCELESAILSAAAMAFTFDGRCVVVLGDDDEKLEIHDIARRRLIAAESLKSGDLPAFRLRTTVELLKNRYEIDLSRAHMMYVQEDSLNGGGIWRLKDMASGQFVKSCNDGWKASYEPAKSLSWNDHGRYSACAERDGVLIWKLCAARTCKFGRTQ